MKFFTILYPKAGAMHGDETLSRAINGDGPYFLNTEIIAKQYVPVARLNGVGSIEDAFAIMNGMGPEGTEAFAFESAVSMSTRGRTDHASMSVGDVIRDDEHGQMWICERAGWIGPIACLSGREYCDTCGGDGGGLVTGPRCVACDGSGLSTISQRMRSFYDRVDASGVAHEDVAIEAVIDGVTFYSDVLVRRMHVEIPNTGRIALLWDVSDDDGIIIKDGDDDVREALEESRRLDDPEFDWRMSGWDDRREALSDEERNPGLCK